MADKIKIVVALALFAAGVAGFYYLAESAMIYRLGALLGGIAAACVVAWFTQAGKEFFAFAKDSWAEVKKVVWPTRDETLRMTALVFGFVLLMAVFLWVTDKSLEVVLYDWVLGWKRA
jgi:preprotein translocase subunit SecE